MQWFFLSIKFSSFKIFRYGIAHIGRVGSVFMTLSVTLERFFAILYPLKRMYLKTTLLIFSVVFSVVYNIPRFLEFETVVGNRTNEEDNSTISNETVSNYLQQKSFEQKSKYYYNVTLAALPAFGRQLFYLWMEFHETFLKPPLVCP